MTRVELDTSFAVGGKEIERGYFIVSLLLALLAVGGGGASLMFYLAVGRVGTILFSY